MDVVRMSLGQWLLLGVKVGLALSVVLMITEIVRSIFVTMLEDIFGFGKEKKDDVEGMDGKR